MTRLFLGIIHDNDNLNEQEKDIYYTSANHLGSANWITEQAWAMPIQYMYYLPFGQLLINQISAGYNERYKFTGKERDGESGYDYFGARYYNSSFMHWMSVDPLSDKYPGISPYAYCHWNPVKFIDPDGRDDEQRDAALNMANQYVKMNPGESYEYSAKGNPGEKVDCSGLVSHCIVAGGENDPNKGKYNGVRNIANNTQKIEAMNDIVAGNLVIFGDYTHIGIISDVTRDKDGNVEDFQFIHSSSSKGPVKSDYNNSKYWSNIGTSGFYKWDTRPDAYTGPTLPQVTVLGNKHNVQNPVRTLNVEPISVNLNIRR